MLTTFWLAFGRVSTGLRAGSAANSQYGACCVPEPARSRRLEIDQTPGPIASPWPGRRARIAACSRAPFSSGDCRGSLAMWTTLAGGATPQAGYGDSGSQLWAPSGGVTSARNRHAQETGRVLDMRGAARLRPRPYELRRAQGAGFLEPRQDSSREAALVAAR